MELAPDACEALSQHRRVGKGSRRDGGELARQHAVAHGIGRKGEMLKKIGTQARIELEEILNAKIYLGLFVKVAENWRENPMAVRELDWHTQMEALGADQSENEEVGSEEQE